MKLLSCREQARNHKEMLTWTALEAPAVNEVSVQDKGEFIWTKHITSIPAMWKCVGVCVCVYLLVDNLESVLFEMCA